MGGIKARIYQLLTNSGFHCLTEFPTNRLPRLVAPMIAVGVKSTEIKPAAVGGYLGANDDQEACIGFLATTTVRLDVYAPYLGGGSACSTTMQDAVGVLLAGGTGQTLRKVRMDNVRFDADADCYRCSALLTFEALIFQVKSV